MSYDPNQIVQFIQRVIKDNEVVLFTKGSEQSPQCGFSIKAEKILKLEKIDFLAVDVMEVPGLREEIKKFTNWPTLPQLYCKGKFIGGADIISELHEKGTLRRELGLESK